MTIDKDAHRQAVFAAVEDFAVEAEELTRRFWQEPTKDGRLAMVPKIKELCERHTAIMNNLAEPT